MKKSLVLILQCLLLLSCSENTDYLKKIQDPELFQAAVQNLSDIIVYDIFSPPVASRVYMYPTMAAYEIMAKAYPSQYYSLAGQLTELEKTPKISEDVNPHLAALLSYNTVGKTFIFSEDKMKAFQDKQAEKIRAMNVPRRVRKASQVYADRISEHILAWAKGDLYNQTRTYSKYTILEEDKFWKPTPPDYMDGIEPHWNKIRPLVLDSANQFQPKAPLSFNLTKGSPFQIQLQEVYEIGIGLTDEQVEIAKFWDCNPYVTHHRGHAMFATKKITPGGHWIGITGIVTRQAKSDFAAVINAYTHVSVALFDAFISCWDEKWDTLVVRPETLINKYYDEKWLPLLQTPPFPEYTSGHSVISRASALVLTKLYGNDFAFEDTTELAYGLPARYYNSFIHASEEAAISRFYGGIHYMMAIDEGVNQGNEIGDYITQNLNTQVEPNQITSSK
tara:strand:+ start:419 stop:1762 length:1344 start_codon:yes stop_codon:yes gene_type:complete